VTWRACLPSCQPFSLHSNEMRLGLATGVGRRVSLLLALLASCTPAEPRPRAPSLPDLPPFMGVETDRWLVQESGPVGRDDVLPAFESSAKDYGCRTEKLGGQSSLNIYGERRSYYGITASCYEGTIAIITVVGGSVLIGCAKPTTIEACNQLLRDISESR
jgi:hypothetical protein